MFGKEFLDETNPLKLLGQWIGSGTKAILIKGGHNPREWCTDLLLKKINPFSNLRENI